MVMTSDNNERSSEDERSVRLRMWLNAFIPRDLDGVQTVPAGPHQGKTMLPSPGPVDAWFLTDQRGFSDDPTAHSRMHSEIEVALPAGNVLSETHCCDDTVQVDPETGEELCCENPDTGDMEFRDVRASAAGQTLTVALTGSTKNACLKLGPIKISPNLDYSGDITVIWNDDLSEFNVIFEGLIESYPAFEMYASLDGSAPVAVFKVPVEPDATPANLAGPPTRAVKERATLKR
jgi:hypothetical protein